MSRMLRFPSKRVALVAECILLQENNPTNSQFYLLSSKKRNIFLDHLFQCFMKRIILSIK